jgi:hypothetical protein
MTITTEDLENAKTDAQALGAVVNGAADENGTGLVPTRTGGSKKTLARLQQESEEAQAALVQEFEDLIAEQAIEEETASQAALVAQQAVQNLASGFYGSVMFADENEEAAVAEDCTLLFLPDSETGGALDISGGPNGVMWSHAAGGTMSIGWEFPTEKYNRLNRGPILMANHTSSANRGFRLSCTPPGTGLAPFTANYVFTFGINGNNATSAAWVCTNNTVPQTVRRVVPVARHDNVNMWLDVLDVDTATWYRGAPVAKPAGFVGMTVATYPMAIGRPTNVADPATAFPADFDQGGSFAPQGISSPRGCFTDALIADKTLSDADILALYRDGADVPDTVGAPSLRFHAPLASNGIIDLRVASNIPAVDAAELTLLGVLNPGPVFKRQGSTYFRMAAIPQPGFIALEYGQLLAKHTWTAEVANLTGVYRTCEYRLVTREGSATDWRECAHTIVGNVATMVTYLPSWVVTRFQVQFRFSSDPTLICATHSDIQVGLHILMWSQSEGVYALGPGDRTGARAVATVAGQVVQQGPGSETITFVNVDNGISCSRRRPGLLGHAAAHFCNLVRQSTEQPLLIAMHMISGTSLRDLMDDSVPGRSWAAEERVHQFVLNRRDDGSIPATGSIKIGWEAGDNVLAYGRDVNFPWYRGRVYPGSTFSFNINHYLHDGTFSPDMLCVELCCNRATSGGVGGTTDTTGQNANEMLQRASQLQWGHELGYVVGRTETLHAMEFEVGGTLSTNAVTHPRPADWKGDLRMTAQLADAVRMVAGVSHYPGVVRFEKIHADPTDPNSVILTLGPPRKYPGLGLANPDTGMRTDAEPHTPNFSGYRLKTNEPGGNPKWFFEAKRQAADAYSIATLVSATIIGGDQVRCTFSGPVIPGQTAVWPHPGNMQYDPAVVNQDTLRAGGLIFDGEQYAVGKEAGVQVTGSHVPLVLA